ncbi:hypothetical protein WBJ53_23700 [Spirosoma sp. SC4-14]|uniref:hypothetical protein n=1 Tax=Spirosoma sp. SC4-14 TaxID=3128900 RepID=UPI0030D12201
MAAQLSPTDTARIGALTRTTLSLGQSLTALNRSVVALSTRTDTLNQKIDKAQPSATCRFCQSELSAGERWLVSMPLLLFVVASFYVLSRLRQEGYKLSDALKENYTVDVKNTPEAATAKLETQKNLMAEGANAAEAEAVTQTTTEVRPQSTSRLIAFFAGMAAIIVSVSAITFFFYVYLRTGEQPEFESLWNVVLGLGVGVVPYAFNRISDALDPKPTK